MHTFLHHRRVSGAAPSSSALEDSEALILQMLRRDISSTQFVLESAYASHRGVRAAFLVFLEASLV